MFTPEVIEQLQYYVYRLIDPRTGNTFYVGKGKGNRLYAHINDALKNFVGESYMENDESEAVSWSGCRPACISGIRRDLPCF